ncbi:MAG: exo-alpha-sialidase, partial [Acidobacteriota bacterium]
RAGFSSFNSPSTPIVIRTPFLESRFVSHGKTERVHSAAVVEISHGRLRAFWYGGTSEHAADVAIYTSVFDPERTLWSPEVRLITAESTQRSLNRYIKKLGNVVVVKDRNSQLWLFYVSVSVGRWSGSAINVTTSKDDGETWSLPRRLISSPFFNLGTLVKGPPVLLEDGTIGLPVYQEFLGRFGELLRLDHSGRVVYKTRLSWGSSSLQPVIIPRSTRNAIGLMRYSGAAPRRVLSLHTVDGGFHWSKPIKTDLSNPNSAVAGIRRDNGDLLLVFNDSENTRNNLSLAYLPSGAKTWRVVYRFEKETTRGEHPHEFSYPYLIQAHKGDFHLVYTWHRTHIKHVQFNQAWLDQIL